jgi:hypothetical protein
MLAQPESVKAFSQCSPHVGADALDCPVERSETPFIRSPMPS